MRIRAVLQHNAAMSNRSASHAERLAHAFDDQTRFSPPPFSFPLRFRSPLQHHVLLHNRNQGGKISVAQRRQTISLPLCPASTQGSSTHFFSTLPFPTNPFFSPSNDKSTSTSSQSISSCTHPLQPSGLPLRPTHPRPFTSSPIKPATASQTPRPASIHSAYPLNLAPFAAPQQIEFLRRAVFSRCTPAGPQDSNLTALLGFLPRVGSVYVWVWHGTSLERVSCVEPVVRARWKWRTRLELQCPACVGSLSRALHGPNHRVCWDGSGNGCGHST